MSTKNGVDTAPATHAESMERELRKTFPKIKRGRPKGEKRRLLDKIISVVQPSGCLRSKINAAHMFAALDLIVADEDLCVELLGSTLTDLMNRTGQLPHGFKTAGTEIGRCHYGGFEDQLLIHDLKKLRRSGAKWGEVADHFRALRLGHRQMRGS